MNNMTSVKRLLLATDFSDWARRAEDYARALAASWRATLTVMTVLEFPPGMNPEYAVNKQYLTDRMSDASARLAEFKQRAYVCGIATTTRIATGMPSEEIIAAAWPKRPTWSSSARGANPVSRTYCWEAQPNA